MIFNSLSSKDGYCSTIAEVSLTRLHNINMEGGEKKRKNQTLGEQIIGGFFFPLLTLIFVNRQSLQLITELNLCLEEYHKYIMCVVCI